MNTYDISSVAATAAAMLGIAPPEHASEAYDALAEHKTERMLIYNPDAVGLWLYEKYKPLFAEAEKRSDFILPAHSYMPSVTPVCFATMYSGASPELHGIQSYTKPILTIDTLFDALIRAGKRGAIIAEPRCSIAKIFLDRNMDYYII